MVTRHQTIPEVISSKHSIHKNDDDNEHYVDGYNENFEKVLKFIKNPALISTFKGNRPKIATREEFMENIKKYSQDSQFSLEANNSKSLIELHRQPNLCDNVFTHLLECNICPLHLEPITLDANMPKSSYYELHPHPNFGLNYDRDYSMISVKISRDGQITNREYYNRIENKNENQKYFKEASIKGCEGDATKYCLKCSRSRCNRDKCRDQVKVTDNSPDESILAGLQTVVNMVELNSAKKKTKPKPSLLRSRQNSPDRSFYNRNVITSSNTMDYLAQKGQISSPRNQGNIPKSNQNLSEEISKKQTRLNDTVEDMNLYNLISQHMLLTKSSSSLEDSPYNYIYGESSKSLVYYNAACGTTESNKSDVSLVNSEDLHSNKEDVRKKTSHVSFKSVSINSTPTQEKDSVNNRSVDNLHTNKSCLVVEKNKSTHSVEVQSQEDDPTKLKSKYLVKKSSSCKSRNKSKENKISVLSVENFKPVEIQTTPIATQDKAVSPPKKPKCVQNSTSAGTTETGKCVPNQVRYAQTVISVFDHYTVYEVMKSSSYKPKNLSRATEGVFVVKS